MRLFTDGAESGDLERVGNSASGYLQNTTDQSRSGARSYDLYANPDSGMYLESGAHFGSGALTEFYVRFAVYASGWLGAPLNFFVWQTTGGLQTVGRVKLETFASPNIFTVSVYDGTTQRAVSGNVIIVPGAWHVFEIHVKIDSAPNGIIEVKFDGTLIVSYTGTTDTISANATRLSVFGVSNSLHTYVDDIAVNDTSGGVNDSWCGDGGVLAALVPTGVGTYSDLTASAGNAYQCVDDVPQNGDTDYIYSSTVGHKSTFAMSNLPALLAGASIARVWTEIVARETAAVGAKIATFIRSGATDIQGSDQTLTLAYGRFIEGEHIVDPNTAAPWSEAGVNAIEAGVRTR